MQPRARAVLLSFLLVAAMLPRSPIQASEAGGADPATEPLVGPGLLWSDPERLMPFGLEQLIAEYAALFRQLGVDMELHLSRAAGEAPTTNFRVVVMRKPEPHWRLRDDVMAVAPRAEGYYGTIYVFFDQVRRVLGHVGKSDPSALPRQHAELARALARILAHEVVHLVAPDHPHATSGLQVAKLRRASLLKRQVRMDPVCARAFREGLDVGGYRSAPALTTQH